MVSQPPAPTDRAMAGDAGTMDYFRNCCQPKLGHPSFRIRIAGRNESCPHHPKQAADQDARVRSGFSSKPAGRTTPAMLVALRET